MNPNIQPSKRGAVSGVINPAALTAGAHSSGWVSLADFGAIMAVVAWGTLGASATLDAKLEQAQDSGGTGVKDITGKAITQVDQTASPTPDDQQAVLNCFAEELDVENGFTHVRVTVTVATATSDGGAVVIGFDARYQAATAAATVVEDVA